MYTRGKWGVAAGLIITSLAVTFLLGSTTTSGTSNIQLDITPTVIPDFPVYLPVIEKPKPPDEVGMVERFAPVLKFDAAYNGLPMSAEAYYQNMLNVPGLSPELAEGTIQWAAERYPTSMGYGPFSDYLGWKSDWYYPSVQTADVDGDGQAELLGRASCGMETWDYNASSGAWYKGSNCVPAWGDLEGWAPEQYSGTIQAADVDGDGADELLARSYCGIETWHYNPSTENWEILASCSPAWSDPEGWAAPQYFDTIQAADVDGDGQAELLGRAPCGMETWHFNASTGNWQKLASCSPAWSDVGTWNEARYYSTIQTADVDGDGQAELLGRAWCGMETWHFNRAMNTWEIVASCSPDWSDPEGWAYPQYYDTIQTADIDGDGGAEMLARSSCGMETWDFNPSSATWQRIADCNPGWADPFWANPAYYLTIQTADIDGDTQAELLDRTMSGVDTWHFNPATNSWELMVVMNPGWGDAQGWDEEPYYSTIQTADIDGDGNPEILGRHAHGMWIYTYSSDSSWHLFSPRPRAYLCGRDDCQWGMSNQDFSSLTSGQVPTYYRVIYAEDGRARIAYWWFYGWQPHCNPGLPPAIPYEGDDGAHHGDWEHILVTTNPERSKIDYVTFYLHGDWYTRMRDGDTYNFERDGERPVVYVGRLGHASYHNRENSGCFGDFSPYTCCQYADFRDPNAYTTWDTDLNLVDLAEQSESWMQADRVGFLYTYLETNQAYTINSWLWGPLHAYCNAWFFECVDWEHNSACSTHPTVDSFTWDQKSCDGVGCGTSVCEAFVDMDYPIAAYYNQPWPWDYSLSGANTMR